MHRAILVVSGEWGWVSWWLPYPKSPLSLRVCAHAALVQLVRSCLKTCVRSPEALASTTIVVCPQPGRSNANCQKPELKPCATTIVSGSST